MGNLEIVADPYRLHMNDREPKCQRQCSVDPIPGRRLLPSLLQRKAIWKATLLAQSETTGLRKESRDFLVSNLSDDNELPHTKVTGFT